METDNLGDADNDEVELVARLRRGDESAYEQVVRQYGPRILAVARRFLQHEQDAQDAVQEALLSAFRSIDRFQGNSRFSTWLHRIGVNAALMKLRSRKTGEQSIDDLLPRFDPNGRILGDSQNWAATYDTVIRDTELREIIRRCLEQLPDSYRAILLLRDIEGKDTDETAELLGLSPGAVKTRLHRARQALRSLLDPYMRDSQS